LIYIHKPSAWQCIIKKGFAFEKIGLSRHRHSLVNGIKNMLINSENQNFKNALLKEKLGMSMTDKSPSIIVRNTGL